MKLTKVVSVIALVGLTLGNFHLAIAATETVPVTDLSLVEESEVGCPECDAAKERGEVADDTNLHDAHYGGHYGGHGHYDSHYGGHYGGHNHGHYGGHYGGHDAGHYGGHYGGHDHGHYGGHGHYGHYSHFHFDKSTGTDGANLPQPGIELKK